MAATQFLPLVPAQGTQQLDSRLRGNERRMSLSLSSRGAAAPDVDAGEQEQPHHVDEMPVPGAELEAEMLRRRELAGYGAEQADDQEGRADDDMGAMEAGRHEERGAIHVAGKVERGVGIFPGLHAGESETERDGEHQTPDQALAVVLQERVMRPGDRGARREQDQRVEQREVPGI